MADHAPWRKPTGIIGYCATAVTTFGYAFAHSWPAVLLLRAFGWMGRGSRGPSRDALLADCVQPAQQGRAFGFERAMDTLGAVLGPLCATLLIGVLEREACCGGRCCQGWRRPCHSPRSHQARRERGTAPRRFRRSDRGSRGCLAATGISWLAYSRTASAISATLLILRAGQILTPRYGGAKAATIAVGLYTFYNVVNAAAAYPAGALADRIGKRGLLAAGYAVGAATYIGFIFEQPTIPVLAILFGFAGVHGAVQQSLERNRWRRNCCRKTCAGSGFGALATANGVGDFVSSIAVGALWSSVSAGAGFLYAGIFSAIGAVIVYSSRAR